MRIVSLLPSATEIVCALGLQDQLVGVTHECDFPPTVRDLPKVTRTLIPVEASSHEIDSLVRERLSRQAALYSLDVPVLEALRPDLLITQALCDVCAVAEAEVSEAACRLPGRPPVLNLEPMSLSDVLHTLARVADATGCPAAGSHVVAELQQRIDQVARRTRGLAHRPRTILLEWIDPPFSCGHWNPELVELAGGVECLGQAGQRSRQVMWPEIRAAQPEHLVIACCGFGIDRTLQDRPILESQPGWRDLPCVQAGQVYVVDGASYFSRPGPRLVDSLEILAHTLHPHQHPLPPGLSPAIRL